MTFCGSKRIVAALDITDPAEPVLRTTYRTGFFPQGLAVSPDGNRLAVADGRYISVLDLSDPEKLTLRLRFRIGETPSEGPVAVRYRENTLLVACRNGGVRTIRNEKLDKMASANGQRWARAFSGDDTVFHNALRIGGKMLPVPNGTPRNLRKLPDGRYCLANGFAGIGIIDPDGNAVFTPDLNRFSCYGANVYDIASGDPVENGTVQYVFLAAGEIGIVTASVSGKEIRFADACNALKWKNINGILRVADNLIYAADETYGLHVLEIQPDGRTLKLVNSLKLTD
ncbi:MAG: hypothetical protein J6Q65_08240, partial [Lentisphaeria bacterium]|nr:hypothetical protein [Lentisphaeria bacterium]